ncbi:hypothetical protein V2O64_18210 [Verrucomicrobiaceae bacterium 227]
MFQIPAILKIGVAIGLVSGLARAADDDLPENTLSEWTFGEAIFGEEAKAEDLQGKVVAIEYWGTG